MDRRTGRHYTILADDDEDDYLLVTQALEKADQAGELHWVRDGEELMDFLAARHLAGRQDEMGMPSLILLDLNMPKKDGWEVMEELKADPRMRSIPIVVLTTSGAREDIDRAYRLGVNSYIRKPDDFSRFVEIMQILVRYWAATVELPR